MIPKERPVGQEKALQQVEKAVGSQLFTQEDENAAWKWGRGVIPKVHPAPSDVLSPTWPRV